MKKEKKEKSEPGHLSKKTEGTGSGDATMAAKKTPGSGQPAGHYSRLTNR